MGNFRARSSDNADLPYQVNAYFGTVQLPDQRYGILPPPTLDIMPPVELFTSLSPATARHSRYAMY